MSASYVHSAEPEFFAADDYFVVRVTSPLQQLLLGPRNAPVPTIYAEIDVGSLVSSLDGIPRLRRTLEAFSAAEGANAGYICIVGDFRQPTSTDGIVLFYDLMEGMARRVGFKHVIVSATTSLEGDWKPLPNPAQDEAPTSEENIGNEAVKVYPVRTALSRRRLHNDCCCIRIDVPPVETWTDEHQAVLVAAACRARSDDRSAVSISVVDSKGSGFAFPSDNVAKALQNCGYRSVTIHEHTPDGTSVSTYEPSE